MDACSPRRKWTGGASDGLIGYGPYAALFEPRAIDPIGKQVRLGGVEYTVVGVMDKRPSPAGFSTQQDDLS